MQLTPSSDADKQPASRVAPLGALEARWRRVNKGLHRVRESINSDDMHECPDEVAGMLDALYDLWELWCKTAGLKSNAQDPHISGNASGEIAAALMFARGGKTHAHLEFDDLTDTFSDTFYSNFGCWRWKAMDRDPRYASRGEWYAVRVAGQEVLPPLESAISWLRGQPELIPS